MPTCNLCSFSGNLQRASYPLLIFITRHPVGISYQPDERRYAARVGLRVVSLFVAAATTVPSFRFSGAVNGWPAMKVSC